jgi:hypothetical protein
MVAGAKSRRSSQGDGSCLARCHQRSLASRKTGVDRDFWTRRSHRSASERQNARTSSRVVAAASALHSAALCSKASGSYELRLMTSHSCFFGRICRASHASSYELLSLTADREFAVRPIHWLRFQAFWGHRARRVRSDASPGIDDPSGQAETPGAGPMCALNDAASRR